MYNYVVFDVETPNRFNNRMSAIGISVIENGVITEEFYSLVNPEAPFDRFNTMLTGISEESVIDSPDFAALWQRIEPLMNRGILVAHNATFDLSVLKSCLTAYEIDWKPYAHYLCTVQVGRRHLPNIRHRLNDLCDYYGISLDHHHAGSDSHACAEILLNYIKEDAPVDKYIRTYKFK
ncbi:MAG: exonuclease [Ruminococcaceae bacterium]|nr:exonuclease [Oscillospiraceae bacterium]